MLRLAARLLLVFAVLAAPTAVAAESHGVSLPRGSREIAGAEIPLYRSSRSFRDTRRFYRRWLARRATPHQEIPTYRFRGVVVSRFLSRVKEGKWLAIHVFRHQGKTRIGIVPRPAPKPKQVLDEPDEKR